MVAYSSKRKLRQMPRRIIIVIGVILGIFILAALISHQIYQERLKAVNSNQTTQIFTINRGSSVKEIADNLEQKHLIRSAWALELYVHSEELNDKLQAGSYALSPSQTTPQIVSLITKGKVTTRLVTILPGRRIDQVRADLINDGFSPSSVDSALQPNNYLDLPALVDKPSSVNSLEGLLWPDSFQKDSNTSAKVIIRESLREMGQHLTPPVRAAFTNEGLTTYQGLILASIVDQEVSKPADQAQAAQVFLSRLKSNMMLGSDVTANYGAIAADHPPSLSYDSPYNTLIHNGLPPTPISTVSNSSLMAIVHPANTNWVYFVTGDDGTTYFSTNLQDQQSNTQKYCHKLCSQP